MPTLYEEENANNVDDYDNDNMPISESERFKGWDKPLPWLHLALTIVLTALLGAGATNATTAGWLFSPTRCTLWVNGACIPKSVPDSILTLRGELPSYESRATGLFSAVHPPFLVVATQVLGCALALKVSLSTLSETSIQIMKHLSILVLVAYGVLFLLYQGAWNLPYDNVFMVEFIYVLAILFIGTYSLHNAPYVVVHAASAVFTYPLLAVAAIAASGEDDADALLTIFFSLGMACLALLAMSVNDEKSHTPIFFSLYWLCLVPCIVHCCVRLQQMAEWPVAPWREACLVLVLVMYVLAAVLVTLVPILCVFRYLDFVIKSTLGFLILIGYFSA